MLAHHILIIFDRRVMGPANALLQIPLHFPHRMCLSGMHDCAHMADHILHVDRQACLQQIQFGDLIIDYVPKIASFRSQTAGEG